MSREINSLGTYQTLPQYQYMQLMFIHLDWNISNGFARILSKMADKILDILKNIAVSLLYLTSDYHINSWDCVLDQN